MTVVSPIIYYKINSEINKKPIGNNCEFKTENICWGQPFQPEPVTKAECKSLKKEFGIKFCHYDDDYWAGAVKRCGGITHMPSEKHLIMLAELLYPAGKNLDIKSALSYGFKLNEQGQFYIWSGTEANILGAFDRSFTSSGTHEQIIYKNYSRNLGICIYN